MSQEKFWNKIARKYAKKSFKGKDLEEFEESISIAKKYLKEHFLALEIGCGTGLRAIAFAPHVRSYLATDISSEMIAIANERKETQEIAHLSFANQSALDSGLEEGIYDVVLSYSVLHLLPDPSAAIGRIYKLLKPGGLFISKTPCLREKSVLMPIVATVVAYFYGLRCLSSMTIDFLMSSMRGQGFELVHSKHYPEKPVRYLSIAQKT